MDQTAMLSITARQTTKSVKTVIRSDALKSACETNC